MAFLLVSVYAGTPHGRWEPSPGHPAPRSLHTLTPLTSGQLLVYGGLGRQAAPLNDSWLFSLEVSPL